MNVLNTLLACLESRLLKYAGDWVDSDKTRRNGFKLKEGRFRLDIRKKSYSEVYSVVRHWNRLPRRVVDVPSVETFKIRMDGALSNLI